MNQVSIGPLSNQTVDTQSPAGQWNVVTTDSLFPMAKTKRIDWFLTGVSAWDSHACYLFITSGTNTKDRGGDTPPVNPQARYKGNPERLPSPA